MSDNGDLLTLDANGSFTFAKKITEGGAYAVTIDCGHKEWAWMGGSNLADHAGVYGTLGTPPPGNVPGARGNAPVAWIDSSGNLWLFGGYGYDSTGTFGHLNDLWKYET